MEKKVAYLYSIFITLIPVLNLYRSGISVITVAELGLIFFSGITIVIMLGGKKITFGRNKIEKAPILFFLSFLFLTCISILLIDNGIVSMIDIFNRFIRLLLWAFTISFTGYYLFNFKIASKWILRIAIIATVYILIQYVFWQAFNIFIPSVMNNSFIQPVSEGHADATRLISRFERRFIRPASFFGEPAFYSYYTLVALALLLFKDNIKRKKTMLKSIFISLGIIVSTSTAGIYLMILSWAYFGFIRLKGNSKAVKIIKALVVSVPLIIIISVIYIAFLSNDSSSELLVKAQIALNKPFEFATSARLGESYGLFFDLEGIQRFVGVGFGNQESYLSIEPTYYNSLTNILLSAGYLGLIPFIIYGGNLIRRKKVYQYVLAIIYLMLCFSSSILYSSTSILYLTIIFYSEHNYVIQKNETQIRNKSIFKEMQTDV